MIVIDDVEYEPWPDPNGDCCGCAAEGDAQLCQRLPECAEVPVIFVRGPLETPQQIYNRVMQEDNV